MQKRELTTAIESQKRAVHLCKTFARGERLQKEEQTKCQKCQYHSVDGCDYLLRAEKRRTWNTDGSCACFDSGKRKRLAKAIFYN